MFSDTIPIMNLVRGYVSFLLVLAGSALLISALQLLFASGSIDLSKAIIVERTDSVLTDMERSAKEALFQGAGTGFLAYDGSHSVSLCQHCIEDFCGVPPSPNYCDPGLCGRCFRIDEAGSASESGAISAFGSLASHGFDPDFSTSFDMPSVRVSLVPENGTRNGFALSSLTVLSDLHVTAVSGRHGIEGASSIPRGTLIRHG